MSRGTHVRLPWVIVFVLGQHTLTLIMLLSTHVKNK